MAATSVAMSAATYQLEGVRQVYSGRCVLELNELQIPPGELLSVVGPNGAGKSTLLRLLAFLERPNSGTIRFQGGHAAYPPPLETRRRIGMVFQRPLMLKRTVRENVAFGLKLRGRHDPQAVDEQIRKMKLEALAGEMAASLSGGEQQRVALARALVLAPEVLLLDEPTANLDPHNVALIEDIVKSLRGSGPATIVLVTHNVFQARRLADRILMLSGGTVVEHSDTKRFFSAPRDPRAAAFIRGDLVL